MNTLLSGAQLLELDPNDIDTGNRIGFFHEDKAAALGRLMAVDGQRDPIKVTRNKPRKASDLDKGDFRKPWLLVTGMHRTGGALIEGIKVWAVEVSGKPEDLADLEASENLHRRPLSPIERAKFTAALVNAARDRIARENGDLKQQQMAVKARWARVKAHETTPAKALTEEVDDTCAKIAHVYGWEESVGEALGMSRRSIHNDLQLSRLLIEPFPELIEALSKHPVVGENAAQLRAIAQVPDEGNRRKVIEALLADAEIGVEDALIQAGIRSNAGRAPTQDEKALAAVVNNLGRLTPALQKRHLPMIVSGLKTAEVKRQLRDLLNRELGE